ncbi:MAG TPA: hypothetical protein VFU81_22165 [Thermomicrobiales bacterium]|nr:hypothetical protein [Thermomicrobiales bacterium]
MPANQEQVPVSEREFVCPNCGHRQMVVAGVAARCEQCGFVITPEMSGERGIIGAPGVGVSYPLDVPPAEVSGGIGRPTDGTQVPIHPSSAVPGKPMPANATAPPEPDDASGDTGPEGMPPPEERGAPL